LRISEKAETHTAHQRTKRSSPTHSGDFFRLSDNNIMLRKIRISTRYSAHICWRATERSAVFWFLPFHTLTHSQDLNQRKLCFPSYATMSRHNLRSVGAVCLILLCFVATGVHALDTGEVVALKDMQLEWGQQMGWTGAPSCEWASITCDGEGHLVGLYVFSFRSVRVRVRSFERGTASRPSQENGGFCK
jgi:hypothetical protein